MNNKNKPVRVALAVFAHNEENAIEPMLETLLQQSVFDDEDGPFTFSLFCLANGCSDNTADAARKVLSHLYPEEAHDPRLHWEVIDYTEPGKSRTWNRFVHEVFPEHTAFVIFLDGDIWFPQKETLALVLSRAIQEEHAHVVVDVPRKHFEFEKRLGLRGRLSMLATRFARETSRGTAIAGSLYCARADFVRRVWMPVGLSGEDGFVKAMAITDLFTRPADRSRVVCEDAAFHVYHAYSGLIEVFQHEVRLAIGTTLNSYLCWDFFAKTDIGCDAGEYIRKHNAEHPEWYRQFVRNEVAKRGRWVLPKGSLTKRFRLLKRSKGLMAPAHLPGAVLRFFLDMPALVYANFLIRKKGGVGYW